MRERFRKSDDGYAARKGGDFVSPAHKAALTHKPVALAIIGGGAAGLFAAAAAAGRRLACLEFSGDRP